MKIVNRNQMRKLDEILLKDYSILELVDKASQALFEHIQKCPCFIMAGVGNNGADGYSLALKLDASGMDVIVYPCDEPKSEACIYYYQKCCEKGLVVDNFEAFKKCAMKRKIGIDAIFGFGLSDPLSEKYEEFISFLNSFDNVVSIDVPSGFDCDSGLVYENCVCASETITFFAYKQGFFNLDTARYLGNVKVVQLEVRDYSEELILPDGVSNVQLSKKKHNGHKGLYGKSLLLCGSFDYRGAALLSTKACVYSGCGITTLSSCEEVLNLMPLYCPEATLKKREDIHFGDYQSVLIGCGLNEDEDLLHKVIRETTCPLVIDATALKILSNHLDWLLEAKGSIVLTPHLKEFERLCPYLDDPIMAAIEFAQKYHVIVVLKGPLTLITNGKRAVRVLCGNGAMATGGTGDVLAGIIVSFLAQFHDVFEAVVLAAYLHGKCADELAVQQHTVLPSQLIDRIPFVMKNYEIM